MPLVTMTRGFAHAKQTILLDYITPSMFTTIPKSIKHKHYPVTITAVVVLCLKVLAIFATSLFEVKNVSARPRSTTFTVLDEFNSNNYNEDSSDTRPLDTAFAILTKNLSAPLATNSQYAVQTFTAAEEVPVHAILQATVDAFSVDLSCEIGFNLHNTTWGYAPDGAAGYLTFRFKTESCSEVAISGDIDNVFGNQQVLALVAGVGCGADFDPSVQALAPNAAMLALAVVQISDMIYPVTGDPVSAQVQNVSAVLCTPTYQLQQATVSMSQAAPDDSQSLEVEITGRMAQNITGILPWTPAQALLGLLGTTSYWKVLSGDSGDYLESLVTDLGTRSKVAAFATPEILSSALTRVYMAFGAQMAKQTLTTKIQNKLPGTYSVYELRIVVNPVTARITEAIMAALIFLTFAQVITLWRRQMRLRLPVSICDLAAIFAASADLKTLLSKEADFSDHEYCLSSSRGFRTGHIQIEAAATAAISKSGTMGATKRKFWLPAPLRLTFAAIALGLPLVLFVLLEALLQSSLRNGHITTIGGYNGVFLWTIVSTAILTGVAMIFDALQFTVNNLETYRYMSQQQASAKQSIVRNFEGTSSAYSLYEGFKYRRIPVATASALSLLAPFLTIFASGLYSSRSHETSSTVSATQTHWFNNTDSAVGFSTGLNEPYSTSTTATLIQFDNLTYPRWTYDELALAQIHVLSSTNASSVSVQLPALQASVQCAAFPASAFVNASGPGSYWLHPPLTCGMSNTKFNDSSTRKLSGTVFRESSFFGGYYYERGSNDFLATCGTFVLGQLSSANNTSAISALHCLFGVNSVQVNANFSWPLYDLISPPEVVPGSERYFANLTLNPDGVLQPVNATQLYGAPEEDGNSQQYQGFMTALTHGINAVPAAQLLSNRTLFVETLTHWYRVSMAQVLNDYYRNNETRMLTGAGATLNVEKQWLAQNVISTRLVQAVLLALWVLGGAVYWTFKPRETLLAWDEKKIGTLNSLGLLGRLCAGVRIERQGEVLDTKSRLLHQAEGEVEVMALVDLPGLSDVQEIDGKEALDKGLLDGWSFGLGFYDVCHSRPDDKPPDGDVNTTETVPKTQQPSGPPPTPTSPKHLSSCSAGEIEAAVTTSTVHVSETKICKYGIYAVRRKVKRSQHLLVD